jgi:hypothetical protein
VWPPDADDHRLPLGRGSTETVCIETTGLPCVLSRFRAWRQIDDVMKSGMDSERDSLPVVPHEWVGGEDCCGCLIAVTRGEEADLICNECGALVQTVSAANVWRVLTEMLLSQREICSVTCPHCGALNTFPGFSASEAFVCADCGEGVVVKHRIV